jgi:ABC-type glycerol-3-phosphate transport system substrate-binding protein
MKIKYSILLSVLLLVVFTFSLVGCQSAETPAEPEAPTEEPAEPASPEEPAEPVAPAEPAEVKDFITWYQYDQENEDPASDERVGNEYLRKTIPEFNAEFEGKWNWINMHKSFDKLYTELVAAFIAGGETPDLFEIGTQNLNLMISNGVVMDLSDWAQRQSWYADMDPNALALCQGPDGGLYCIPFAQRPHLTYVWADHYPNGYPTTPEQFMLEAERLKEQGTYAWTYFGSTAYSGNGTGRMIWALISSFGGTFDDGNGNMLLNTPENVAAISFLRETVEKQYNPDTVFAGGFVEEDSFKDASAAAIPTGLFGYRYINPLTAPDGTKYEKGNENDMLDAIAAGDVVMAPMFAPEGQTPGCSNDVQGVAITANAKNVEAAYDYINWLMQPHRHAEFAIGPGAGFPVLKAAQQDLLFQTPFYIQAAQAIEKSACRPWFGSLERVEEAQDMIMITIYKLIKEDPTLDIATELQMTQDEYNANN